MSPDFFTSCCLALQNIPENASVVLNFSPVAADPLDFSTPVYVLLRRRDLTKAAVLSTSLSATGALSLDLSGTDEITVKFRDFISRYVSKYSLEVVRQDTHARVNFKRVETETETFPGFCFCAFGCEIPVPNPLPVGLYVEACPNACSAC